MRKLIAKISQIVSAIGFSQLSVWMIGSLIWSQLASGLVRPATSDGAERLSDPFAAYQWVLYPRDQSLVLAIDFVHSDELQRTEASDIHWQNFDSRMKRDVVIAVMDSGVEVSHPDLREGLLPGMSFVEKIEGDPANVLDDVGHGTHMASIMAARIGNQIGLSGFSNRIKVLPLKVYDDRDGHSEQRDLGCGTKRPPIGKRIIAAIDYAISRKVDVINFSMGWPLVANGPQVVAAFERAKAAGIVIVAAAGNDHHDGPIYPCSYSGVICVGSVDIDGKLSAFSDFGGQVDILAPGQEILGAWPTGYQLPSLNFQVRGYEVSSGTSQAASIVSSSVAVLRGLFPQESALEIRRRLLGSARHSMNRQPKVNAGLLDLSRAAEPKTFDYTAPDFKGVEMALVSLSERKFSISIKIEGTPVTPIQVDSQSEGVKVLSTKVQSSQLEILGEVANLEIENQFVFRVHMNGREFYHRVALVLDAIKSSREKFASPLLADLDDRVMSNSPSRKIELWGAKAEDGGLTLRIWRKEQSKQSEHQIHFDQVNKPLAGFGLIRQDWRFNGKETYLFAALQAKEKNCQPAKAQNDEAKPSQPQTVQFWFYYLDENFKLIEKFSLDTNLNFVPILNSNPRNVIVGRIKRADGTYLGVPVFFSRSDVPKEDVNADPFAFATNEVAEHWFYLNIKSTDHHQFETRALDAWSFEKFLRAELSLASNEPIDVLGLQTQSLEDLKAGRVRILTQVGQSGRQGRFVVETNVLNQLLNKDDLKRFASRSLNLTNSLIRQAWMLSSNGLNWGTEYQQAYGFNSARVVTVSANADGGVRENAEALESQLKLDQLDEKILGVVQTFRNDREQMSFLQTSEYLRVMGTWNGKKVDGRSRYYRSRILPGEPFAQLLTPVLVGHQRQPAVVSDYSLILSPRISTYVIDDQGQLRSPLRLSFYLPEACSLDDSQLWAEEGYSQIGLHCRDQSGMGQYHVLDLK